MIKGVNINSKFKKIVPAFIVGLFMTATFLFGYFLGNGEIRQIGPIKLKPAVINKEEGKPQNVDFKEFWDAWNLLEQKYVGDLDYQKMVYGAIKGMVESTGDPYTVFLDPEEAKSFKEDIDGSFSGVGIEIGIRNKQLVVISPVPGTPAEKAGLKANDKVLKINDKETTGMSIDEAVKNIRGPEGTEVTLTIQRGNEELKDYKLKRAIITVESVKLDYKDTSKGKMAVIKISKFDSQTSDKFNKAAEDILLNHPSGIVLDLRGNPGGFLDGAIDVASEFFDGGLIVIEESKGGAKKEINASKKGKLTSQPLVVLIDGGSASAAEIVAGAIKDRGRGTIIGEKSFGKGTVQEVLNLNNTILKITISKWLTPKGKSINNDGIEPDNKVDLTQTDIDNNKDPQMDEALRNF